MNPIQKILKNTIIIYKEYLFNNTLYCLLCEKSFDNFSFIGIDSDSEFICPNCSSTKLERYLWLFINSKLRYFSRDFSNDKKYTALLVDLQGSLAKKLSKIDRIHCITLDSNYKNGHLFIKQIETNSIDLIIGNYLLEKSNQLEFLILELKRILIKEIGIILIQSDINELAEKTISFDRFNHKRDRERIYGNEEYFRRFGRDFEDVLKEYDLILNYDDENIEYLSYEAKKRIKLNNLKELTMLHIDTAENDSSFFNKIITNNYKYINDIENKVLNINMSYANRNFISKFFYLIIKTIAFLNVYVLSNITSSISYFTKDKELLADAILGIITGLAIGIGNVLSYPDFEIHSKLSSLGVLIAVLGIWFFIARQLWNFKTTDYFQRTIIKNITFSTIVILMISIIYFKYPNCGIDQQFYDWELNKIYGGDKELMHKWKNRE